MSHLALNRNEVPNELKGKTMKQLSEINKSVENMKEEFNKT